MKLKLKVPELMNKDVCMQNTTHYLTIPNSATETERETYNYFNIL